jgi:hypothetical protein
MIDEDVEDALQMLVVQNQQSVETLRADGRIARRRRWLAACETASE